MAVLIALFMVFSMVPVYSLAAGASDISDHWAKAEIQSWLDLGIISGYQDGTFKPNNNITRAEFMSIVNNAFEYKETEQINFSDVSADAWYFSTISKAKAAGYITGYPDGTMKPSNPITREEVASIIIKINKIEGNPNKATKFTDESTFGWSKSAIEGVAATSIMLGYPDGTFKPKDLIKRGEAVYALKKAVNYSVNNIVYDIAGTYGPETGSFTAEGNVTVKAAGTVLQNMTINGNLTITKEVGDGNVTLKNVTVKGETIVNGGGINSIVVIDSTLGEVTVSKIDGKIRIVISGNSSVSVVNADSGCTLEESNITGGNGGFKEIIIDADSDDTIILNGSFDKVTINSTGVEVQVPDETKIGTMVINASADITGTGTISKAEVNASGVTFENSPNTIITAEGVTDPIVGGVVGGGGGGGGEIIDYNCTIPQAATYDRYNGTTLNIEMSLAGGGTLLSISDGTLLTTPGQYIVNGNIATLTQAYMQSLPVGQKTLTFSFTVGLEDTIVITVTDSLQAAINVANVEIGKVAAAQTAYLAADGLATDAVYTDVTDAKTALEAEIAATPQVKANIQSATATLTSKLDALGDATDALIEAALLADAIDAANTEIGKVAAAQAEYITYNGLAADVVYTDVTDAKTALEEELDATPRVTADILSATATLTSKLGALDAATDVLIAALNNAVDAANTEIGKVTAAQAEYITYNGLATDAVYTDVTDAKTALEAELDATPQVTADILSATATLTSKLDALEDATDALIEALNNAVDAANTEIGKVTAAQAEYITYNGLATDEVYTDVTDAKTALEEELDATPRVTADILSATATLTSKLDALDDATDVLIAALEDAVNAANTEIGKVTAAQAEYIIYDGLATDAVYTDVTDAKTALEAELDATPQVTADILSATATLTSKLDALDDATDVLIEAALLADAIDVANTEIGKVTAAQTAYTVAGGLTTDTVYTDVTGAKATLEDAIAAETKVRATIESATTALTGKLSALEDATDVLVEAARLVDAINTAYSEIDEVAAALTAYTNAGGLTSDLVYTDVTTAQTALETAIAADPQVRATIESLTTALTNKLGALNTAKNTLIELLNDAIDAANTEIGKVAAAQTAYINAGGLATDTVYTDVTDAKAALEAELAATPKVRTDIISATTTLTNKLSLLDNATTALLASLQEAVDAANVELDKVSVAQAGYVTVGGATTDAVYTDVTTAKTALEGAIATTPQVKATIVSLTAALTSKIDALNDATGALIEAALLADAIADANTELGKVAAAQTDYTVAGGLATDAVYTDVTSAKTALENALAAETKVRATIESATTALTGKLSALSTATDILIDAALLADADDKVAALELAADEDLLVEANLIAAEALVGPAQTAVTAATGITGINAIAARLATAKGIVEDAREYFDSTSIILLTALGTGSTMATVQPGHAYCTYNDTLLMKYVVNIKLSMLDAEITTGAKVYKLKVGNNIYTMSVNQFNADILSLNINYSGGINFSDVQGATLIVEH